MRRRTHHPTRRATLNHTEGGINLLMTHLHESLGLVAEPADTVAGSAVISGMEGLRSHNHKPKVTEWTRTRGRMIGNLGTHSAKTLEVQDSPTLTKGMDSEPVR